MTLQGAKKLVPNKLHIPHYEEVMLETWSKGMYKKAFIHLMQDEQYNVIDAIKDDIKENGQQMKEWADKTKGDKNGK